MLKGVFLWWKKPGIVSWFAECLCLFALLTIGIYGFHEGRLLLGWLCSGLSGVYALGLIKRSLYFPLIGKQRDDGYQRLLKGIARANWLIVFGCLCYSTLMVMRGRLDHIAIEDRAVWVGFVLACTGTIISGLVVYAPAIYFISRNRTVLTWVLVGVLCISSAVGLGWISWWLGLLIGFGTVGVLPFTSALEGYKEFQDEQERLQKALTDSS